MKKRKNLWQLCVLFVLGAAVVFSLMLPQLPSQQKEQKILQLSVLIPQSDSSLWTNTRLGLEQAALEFGAEIRFLTLTKDGDAQEQEQLLYKEAQGGADAILIAPVDSEQIASAVEQVECPVIGMESPIATAQAVIAPQNEQMGQALAQAAAKDWMQETVILLDSAPTRAGICARLDAAQAYFEKLHIPVHRMSLEELKRLPQQERMLLAFEPAMTEQLLQLGQGKIYGTGISGQIVRGLEQGNIRAIAAWSDYAVGYLAAECAVKYAQESRYQMEALPFAIVRGDEIYEPENQKLLFPVTS